MLHIVGKYSLAIGVASNPQVPCHRIHEYVVHEGVSDQGLPEQNEGENK